jgi:hypothetical protein
MTRCKTSREKPGTFPTFEPLKHSEENLSDQPLEVVLIELKPRPVDFKPAPITLDAVKLVDTEHHLVPLENDRVRVLRTILEPHLKSRMREHPHYVVMCRTELHTTMKLGDGKVIDNPRRPGEIAWPDALNHVENIEDRTGNSGRAEVTMSR